MDEYGKIEIDLASLLGRPSDEYSIYDAIKDAAVERLLAKNSEAMVGFSQRVQQITDEEIRKRLEPILDDAINAAIQPTNTWGEPKGEPTTMREYLAKKMELELKKRDTHHRGTNKSLLEEIIERQIREVLGGELKGIMDTAASEIVINVREQASEMFAEIISAAAGRIQSRR